MKKNKLLMIIMSVFALSLVFSTTFVSYSYASKGGGGPQSPSYSLDSTLDPDSGEVYFDFQWQGFRINHIYVYVARDAKDTSEQMQIAQYDFKKTQLSGTVSDTANVMGSVVIPGYRNVDAYISVPSEPEHVPGYYEYHIYVVASNSKHRFVLSDYNLYNTAGGIETPQI
jgi:hypothetical protein